MAITLHRDRIDLAHVSRDATGRPVVRSLDSYRKGRTDAEALEALRRRHSLGRHRCITALASGEYQILQVEAPDVPRDEMKEAVRWRIKDLIEYSPEAATIDVAQVPAEAGSRARGLHVFCTRRETVGGRMRLFAEAKIPLEAIDVPEMALRNVAALWARPGRSLALIGFDETGGTLVIVANGELATSRHIDASTTDLDDADEAHRRAHLERVALELQRSFDFCDRQFGSLPLERLIVAAPTPAPLIEYLSATLYVPVERVELAGIVDFPSVPELRDPARQAQCLVTLGLALRAEEAPA